jgi:hypothetical protein
MSTFIKSLVTNYPSLEYQRNQGEDRVRKKDVRGSLWIKERYNGFRLQTTSEIASILDNEIEKLSGSPIGEQKGYKYWHIDDWRIVEKIVEFLERV